jgi:fructose-1,6-bisphosphatase I
MDIIAHDIMTRTLLACPAVGIMVSEEAAQPILGNADTGTYAVCFDPLDGSSNVESCMPTGTLFGIFKIQTPGSPSADDLLQRGDLMVAAGYVLYSSATILAVTLGVEHGVQSFTVDPQSREYVSSGKLVIPETPSRIISANAGRSRLWGVEPSAFMQAAISAHKPYTFRYTGAMVADLHRTLVNGGVFFYPSDRDYPSGKLRVLYECFPAAMLTEAAGGTAVHEVADAGNTSRLLDMTPTELHQRTPIFTGCKRDVSLFSELTGAKAQAAAMRKTTGHGCVGSQPIIASVSSDYSGDPDARELDVRRGQLITKLSTHSDPAWLTVTMVTGECGLVPTSNVSCFNATSH